MSELKSGLPNGPVLYLDTTQSVLHLGLSMPDLPNRQNHQPDRQSHQLIGQGHQMVARYQQQCDSHRYHSAVMTPAIDQLLKQAGLKPKELAGIAVNPGPGSFTGVRTGIITARTLAQFLPVPVYVTNTFDLLAWDIFLRQKSSRPVAIYMDALRGRAYHAVLACTDSGFTVLKKPTFVTLAVAVKPGQPLDVIQQDLELPEPSGILASTELHPLLLAMQESGILTDSLHPLPNSDAWDVPGVMMSLLSTHGQARQVPWREVLPLYIQEPSVTVKKSIIHG